MEIKKNLFITSLIATSCCNLIMSAGEEKSFGAWYLQSPGLVEAISSKDLWNLNVAMAAQGASSVNQKSEQKGEKEKEKEKEQENQNSPQHNEPESSSSGLASGSAEKQKNEDPEIIEEVENKPSAEELLIHAARTAEFSITDKQTHQNISSEDYGQLYANVQFAREHLPIRIKKVPSNQEVWIWARNAWHTVIKPMGDDEEQIIREHIHTVIDVIRKLLQDRLFNPPYSTTGITEIVQSFLSDSDRIIKTVEKFVKEFDALLPELQANCLINRTVWSESVQNNLDWGLRYLPVIQQRIDRVAYDNLFITYLPYDNARDIKYYVCHVSNRRNISVPVADTAGHYGFAEFSKNFDYTFYERNGAELTQVQGSDDAIITKIINPFCEYLQKKLEEYLIQGVLPAPMQSVSSVTSCFKNYLKGKYVILDVTAEPENGHRHSIREQVQLKSVQEQKDLSNQNICVFTLNKHSGRNIEIVVCPLGITREPDKSKKITLALPGPSEAYEKHIVNYTLKSSSFLSNASKSGLLGAAALAFAMYHKSTFPSPLVSSLLKNADFKPVISRAGSIASRVHPAAVSAAGKLLETTTYSFGGYSPLIGAGIGAGLYGGYLSYFKPHAWPAARNVFQNAALSTTLGSLAGSGVGSYFGLGSFGTGMTSGLGGLLGLWMYNQKFKKPVYIESDYKQK